MDARRRFLISCIMLSVFVSAGCVCYMLIERVGLLEAAYMTIITISTVGFKEVFELSAPGKVFTMFLVMLGVGSVYYASVSLVTLFVGGELRTAREKLKVQKRINELKDHIVLCGYGRMGSLVAEQLRAESAALVVLDNDPDRIAALERTGMLCIEADASEEASLLEAGITRARALVATLPRDSDNVYVTLTARGLGAMSHAHPTYSEAVKEAALAVHKEQIHI